MSKTQKDQAMEEIETLGMEFKVDGRIKEYFLQGSPLVITYDPMTAMMSEQALEENPELEYLVQCFQKKEGVLVYYVLSYGSMIMMLYVGRAPNMWGYQAPQMGSNLVYIASCDLNKQKLKFKKGLVPMHSKNGALLYASCLF